MFLFNKIEDKTIQLKDVKECKHGKNIILRFLSIHLKDGASINFVQHKWFLPASENIDQISSEIDATLEQYRRRHPEPSDGITEEHSAENELTEKEIKKIRRRIYFSIVGVLATYIFIGMPIAKLIFPHDSPWLNFRYVSGFSGVIVLGIKLVSMLTAKKRKQAEQGN